MNATERDELAFWPSGFGIVQHIRSEGGRVWFTFSRPGRLPEELWLAPAHFDARLHERDWAVIESIGEGPPEPDWTHAEVRRVVPPTNEVYPSAGTLHIADERRGVRLTMQGTYGVAFSWLRDRHGVWHGGSAWQSWDSDDHRYVWHDDAAPLNDTTAVLEMLHAAWIVARNVLPSRPDAPP